MRQRVVSSVVIVVIAMLPLVLGGPAFTLLMIVLGAGGFLELSRLAHRLGADRAGISVAGYPVVVALGVAALAGANQAIVIAIITVAVFAPLATVLSQPNLPNVLEAASLSSMSMLYLGLPTYAAIAVRETAGTVDQQWLTDLANLTALGWSPAPRGLAWTALIVVTIWVGDSLAFLGGRRFGRRRLAPRISPGKTMEGSLFGLAGSALAALLCVGLFGLSLPPWGALALGTGIGVAGQLGDLIESLLKRLAGVKDSGTLIPGHGGLLDRIDALALTFPLAWVTVTLVDGWLP